MLSMMLMLFMALMLMYRLLQLLVIRLVCVWSTRSIAPALIAPVVLNWARQLCSK